MDYKRYLDVGCSKIDDHGNEETKPISSKKHLCNECNFETTYKQVLTKHVRTHTGERPFNCDICHKKFSQKGHLQRHTFIHQAIRPHECDLCDFKAAQKQTLVQHRLTHFDQEKHFECDLCDFKKKSHSKCFS